jgi:hypothetical protein
MNPDRRTRRHVSLYRALLILYPADFRRQFGPSMAADFHDRLDAEQRRRPHGATWRTWAPILRDLFLSVPEQRWEKIMARTTAAVAAYSVIAFLVITAITRTVSFTWLVLSLIAVACTRWVANAPDPQSGRARLRIVAWISLAVAASTAPLLWWSGIPEAIAVIGIGLHLLSHRLRPHPVA